MSCRASYYQAFYRKKPASANISALAFECTNFSLTVGFVALRMCKLILAAALFVGRIDTPVLADGVGRFGNFEIDNYPYIFYKDILSHEAHRHPYIELLGVMYLMKLRYGTLSCERLYRYVSNHDTRLTNLLLSSLKRRKLWPKSWNNLEAHFCLRIISMAD